MQGIVSCIKESTPTYYLVGSDGHAFFSGEYRGLQIKLNLGELVDVEEGKVMPLDGDTESVKGSIEKDIAGAIKNRTERQVYLTGIEEVDKATERMWKKLGSAAGLLLRKLYLCQPIIVRFHNDADGSSGATGLYLGISEAAGSGGARPNTIWIMHKGVSYSSMDAESDILLARNYSAVEKPLLVIVDFGTSKDSNEGIKIAEKNFEIIWLDHHPIEEGFEGTRLDTYINPWMFGADSAYTAGMLACIFARSFSDVDTGELEIGSMVGDYSRFAPKDNDEVAMILDLVTSEPRLISRSESGLTPAEIDSVLNDNAKRKELYNYAKMRLDEAIASAMESVKRYSLAKGDIYVLDYEETRSPDSKYPLPGRFASKFLAKVEGAGKPCVVVVHFGMFVSMRVSAELGDGVDVPGIIAGMKTMYPDLIEAGGGHRNAASLKLVAKENKKEVLTPLLEQLRSRLE